MTPRLRGLLAASAALATLAASPAGAQEKYAGFLCCNLRSDGSWISDINYAESGKTLIAFGTPVRITGYGSNRVHVQIDGTSQSIGNDYSRELDLAAFARRYVVTEDPRPKLAAWPAKIQEAIRSARVTPGMTRDQVVMAVGYPVTSENPHLDARVWRYWLWSFSEFKVAFGTDGRVSAIETDDETRRVVVLD